MTKEGKLTIEQARKKCWLVDSSGLITNKRDKSSLAHHKIPWAHEHEEVKELSKIVASIKPLVLIGVSGVGGTFTKEVIEEMCKHNPHPVIFALSNPTDNSECTFEEALKYSNGTCLFASGSPFPTTQFNGRKLIPSQGNNSYIFPGLGLAITYARMTTVPDEVFYIAAKAVADLTTEEDFSTDTLYPPLSKIRHVSLELAVAVVNFAFEKGLTRIKKPSSEKELREEVKKFMYDPEVKLSSL